MVAGAAAAVRFAGLKDYSTDDTGRLRQELQRQNNAVDESLAALERERAARPVRRTVADDSVAVHDEALLVVESCRIELPPSDHDRPFRTVTIVVTRTGLTITVAAASGEFVMGSSPDETFAGIAGIRRYEDDGQGTWWRAF
jgi:hypothetical protein